VHNIPCKDPGSDPPDAWEQAPRIHLSVEELTTEAKPLGIKAVRTNARAKIRSTDIRCESLAKKFLPLRPRAATWTNAAQKPI